MKFQSTLLKPLIQTLPEYLSLLLAATVRHSIIGITSKRLVGMVSVHPLVELVEEKISENWTYDTPLCEVEDYAKLSISRLVEFLPRFA